jgi:hypothetical protein
MTISMDMAVTNTRMGLVMKGSGKMINRKVSEPKPGKMAPVTKGISSKGRNMDKVGFLWVGRYEWSDGAIYNGEWHDNKIAGHGVY